MDLTGGRKHLLADAWETYGEMWREDWVIVLLFHLMGVVPITVLLVGLLCGKGGGGAE